MTELLPPWLWIVLTGVLAAGSCGLIGCYLVLRRMALVGDAISHAVLPGIVLAFLVTGSRAALPMLIGAGLVGLLTTFLIESLERTGRVQQDASIGITFTSLFSVGVLLVAVFADSVDLDQECVLYGEIAYVPWDVVYLGGADVGPRAFVTLLGVLVADALFIAVFWKELMISSFDAAMAHAVGLSAGVIHYALMAMVSVTVVGAFESVGAILVVAMLVVPGATAYLWTDRLRGMLGLSLVVSTLSAVGGYLMARALDCSIAGAMATVAGFLLFLSVLVAPRQGVLSRWVTRAALRLRIGAENLIGELLQANEEGTDGLTARELSRRFEWSASFRAVVLWWAERRGLVESLDGRVRLLALGLDEAKRVRTAHESWESELTRLGYDEEHAHASAHRLEHVASPESVREESVRQRGRA